MCSSGPVNPASWSLPSDGRGAGREGSVTFAHCTMRRSQLAALGHGPASLAGRGGSFPEKRGKAGEVSLSAVPEGETSFEPQAVSKGPHRAPVHRRRGSRAPPGSAAPSGVRGWGFSDDSSWPLQAHAPPPVPAHPSFRHQHCILSLYGAVLLSYHVFSLAVSCSRAVPSPWILAGPQPFAKPKFKRKKSCGLIECSKMNGNKS